MSKAVLFFADGTEECEALLVADLLRRAGRSHHCVCHGPPRPRQQPRHPPDRRRAGRGCGLQRRRHGHPARRHPGYAQSRREQDRHRHLRFFFAKAGKKVAAICAAPSVLASLGLLEGRNATAHAGFQDKLAGAIVHDEEVVVDGSITTTWPRRRDPVCPRAGAPAGRLPPKPTASRRLSRIGIKNHLLLTKLHLLHIISQKQTT